MILYVTLTDYDITEPFPFEVEIAECAVGSIEFQGSIPE